MASETLYSGENYVSEDFKITRLARQFRDLRITKKNAHVSVVGYMSSRLLLLSREIIAAERATVEALLWEKRGKLVYAGVAEDDIVVYEPYQLLPLEGRLIVLTAHESAPGPLFPKRADTVRAIQPADPNSVANVVTEPKTKDSTRSAEIEITVWESESTKRKHKVTTSFTVGPNRFEEAGAELTAVIGTIKRQHYGAIRNIEFSVKVEGGLEHEEDAMKRVIGEWALKAKASLAAELELHIPHTSIKATVEISLYADSEGKPGAALKIILLRFW
jgi:hypothetical protein